MIVFLSSCRLEILILSWLCLVDGEELSLSSLNAVDPWEGKSVNHSLSQSS